MMYFVKILHHPDMLIPKNSVTFTLSNQEKLHMTFHRTFVEALYEYFGDPEYDVTPYNQRTIVISSMPPRAINPRVAIELIKRANEHNHGDELTNVLFNSVGFIIAILKIDVIMFTFDKYDPRNIENWPMIAENVKHIHLYVKDKIYNCLSLYVLKQFINGEPKITKVIKEWFDETFIQKIINETREAIRFLDILSDDLTTYLLRSLTIPDEDYIVDCIYDYIF